MAERVHNPLFARFYAALDASPLNKGVQKDRRKLLAGLAGTVVEVGAGAGGNFPFYPPEVDEVLAYEPEPYLRAKAEEAARKAKVKITVGNATASLLPLQNGVADAVVMSLVLCTVPSVEGALAEAYRVLKHGGLLHFYEHVRADGGVVRAMQRVADATLWPRLFGNCHTGRDTLRSIEDAGFTMEKVKRADFRPLGLPLPMSPQTIGIARKP